MGFVYGVLLILSELQKKMYHKIMFMYREL